MILMNGRIERGRESVIYRIKYFMQPFPAGDVVQKIISYSEEFIFTKQNIIFLIL